MNYIFPFPMTHYSIDEPRQKFDHMLQNSTLCGGAHGYSDYTFVAGA